MFLEMYQEVRVTIMCIVLVANQLQPTIGTAARTLSQASVQVIIPLQPRTCIMVAIPVQIPLQ